MDPHPMKLHPEPDGWAILTHRVGGLVKQLTYELRTSKTSVAALRRAKVDPSGAIAIDWKKVNSGERFLAVTSADLIRVDSDHDIVEQASVSEARGLEERLQYARDLIQGPLRRQKSEILTAWLRTSPDPIPARLRKELTAHSIGPERVAVAEAFARGIDEVFAHLFDAAGDGY